MLFVFGKLIIKKNRTQFLVLPPQLEKRIFQRDKWDKKRVDHFVGKRDIFNAILDGTIWAVIMESCAKEFPKNGSFKTMMLVSVVVVVVLLGGWINTYGTRTHTLRFCNWKGNTLSGLHFLSRLHWEGLWTSQKVNVDKQLSSSGQKNT